MAEPAMATVLKPTVKSKGLVRSLHAGLLEGNVIWFLPMPTFALARTCLLSNLSTCLLLFGHILAVFWARHHIFAFSLFLVKNALEKELRNVKISKQIQQSKIKIPLLVDRYFKICKENN